MDFSDRLYFLAHFANNQQRDRALFYLQEDTRPDFDDEVPEDEQTLFETVDEIPYPSVIKNLDDEDDDAGLYWAMADEDGFPDLALAEKLGAEKVLVVHAQIEDEPCFTIAQKLANQATKTVFVPRFFDDRELDEPVERFTELLEAKLAETESSLKFMLWLQGYLVEMAEQGEKLPDTLAL